MLLLLMLMLLMMMMCTGECYEVMSLSEFDENWYLLDQLDYINVADSGTGLEQTTNVEHVADCCMYTIYTSTQLLASLSLSLSLSLSVSLSLCLSVCLSLIT